MCLPPLEIVPHDGRTVYVAGQNYGPTLKDFFPIIDDSLRQQMINGILELHKLLDIKGMSRTDLRVANDEIYVLDINTMPNLDPQRSYLPVLMRAHGKTLSALIESLVESSLSWYEQKSSVEESHSMN